MVDVDTAGTDDPSDDTLAISGGDQALLAAVDPTPQGGLTQVAVGERGLQARVPPEPQLGGGRRPARQHQWRPDGCCSGSTTPATARPTSFAALAPYELLISDSLPLAFLQK